MPLLTEKKPSKGGDLKNMSNISEDTVNELLISFLRNNGINVSGQETGKSMTGVTKQPDIWVEDNGAIPGEGEWEDSALEGLVQARDYSELIDAKSSFLVIYPMALKKELQGHASKFEEAIKIMSEHKYRVAFLRPLEQTDLRVLSLVEIPQWLRTKADRSLPNKQEVDMVISLLRSAVAILTQRISSNTEGVRNLFRNVLGADPNGEDVRNATRAASGYLLIDQLSFYHILSSYHGADFEPINTRKLSHPTDLLDYFAAVMKIDYLPIFSIDTLSPFKVDSLSTIIKCIIMIQTLNPEALLKGALGKLFHELIPLNVRKPIGAYYTLEHAAGLLAKLSINSEDAIVFDPSCGSGTLLAASYRRLVELMHFKATADDLHRKIVTEQLYGSDIMPFAAHLSAIHLAIQSPNSLTDKVEIGIADSTVLDPTSNNKIYPINEVVPRSKRQMKVEDSFESTQKPEKLLVGKVHTKEIKFEPIVLSYFTNIIMNPPFTKHQRFSQFGDKYLQALKSTFLVYRPYINGRMPYSNYFILLADKFLKENGIMGSVLPATVLRGDSSTGIRNLINLKYQIKAIIVRDDQRNFSEDTMFREILLLLKKGSDKSDYINYVILHKLNENIASEIKDALEETNDEGNYDFGDFNLKRVKRKSLDISNWFRPISLSDDRIIKLIDDITNMKAFAKFKTITNDIRTKDSAEPSGCPSFKLVSINAKQFNDIHSDLWSVESVSSDKVISINRKTGIRIEVPRSSLRLLFRRPPYHNTIDTSTLEEFVIAKSFPEINNVISLGRIRKGIDWVKWNTYLDSRKSNLSIVDRLDISASGTSLMSFFNSKGIIWARTPAAVLNLKTVEAKLLNLWLNSTFGIAQIIIERMPTRGAYFQLHNFIIEEMMVPKLDKIQVNEFKDKNAEDLISEIFDRVKDIKFPSIVEQLVRLCSGEDRLLRGNVERTFGKNIAAQIGTGFEARIIIDTEVLKLIGYNKDLIIMTLEWLYPSMLNSLIMLKEIMGDHPSISVLSKDDINA